jgi:hypothetical protein
MSNSVQKDSVELKLRNLLKATAATERLIYGDLAGMASRAVIQPNLKSIQIQLARLTMLYDIKCFELARILTTSPRLLPDSKPARAATNWLNGVKNQKPSELQNPAGYVEICKAAEIGDVKFFIQLGESLRNKYRDSTGPQKRLVISKVKIELWLWWKPSPELNWPGLAYCKNSAQWEFFDILFPKFSRNHGSNYLDNERRKMKLVRSSHCFISSIGGTTANFCFS